jgi:redox-sensitive bicupin YhaK (pirin superfamily)
MPIEVRSAKDRFRTRGGGRDTWHSFSFGSHYDPHNIGFGALLAHNDEHLTARAGYPDHPHAGTEIVTWVLEGALHHRDSAGNEGVLEAGDAQVLSTGDGLTHTEYAEGVVTRFVQTWLRPDEPGGPSAYAVARAASAGATCIASGGGDDGPLVRTRGAACHVVVLGEDESFDLPDAPRLHAFLVDGAVLVGERELRAGGAARLVDEGGRSLRAESPARLLVWSLP